MSRIQTGRFSQLLRRFLDQKGTEVVASELSPEISPVFILENDRPDWLFLKGERLLSFSTQSVSVATLGPTFRLRNPPDSGMLGTVSLVTWSSDTVGAASIRITISNNDLAGGFIASTARDGRNLQSLGINKAAMIVSFNATIAPVGDLMFTTRVPIDIPFFFSEPVVLSPGRALDVGGITNQSEGVFGSMHWTERALPQIEAA